MSNHASLLPDSWVRRIWGAMRATYGAAFDRMWPCPPCPPGADAAKHVAEHTAALLAHWSRVLGYLHSNPSAIHFALENLPANPPNLIEFQSICGRAPRPNAHLTLPAPEVSREGLVRIQQKMAAGLGGAVDPLNPLRHLMLREMAGDRAVNKAQRDFWRKALRLELLRVTGIDVSGKFEMPALRAAVEGSPVYMAAA